MKIYHNSDVDYLSIDFKDEVESKSEYKDGIIVRYDKKGHVIGIDITDSMKLFSSSDHMTLQEACEFLGISESTMRRRIRAGKIKFIKGKIRTLSCRGLKRYCKSSCLLWYPFISREKICSTSNDHTMKVPCLLHDLTQPFCTILYRLYIFIKGIQQQHGIFRGGNRF